MGGLFPPSHPAFTPDPGPIALGTVGQVLTIGAGGNPAFAPASGGPTVVFTAADQNKSAVSNDPTLTFGGQPAGSYFVDCLLNFAGGAAATPIVGFNRGGTFITGIQAFISSNSTNTIAGSAHAIDGSTMVAGVASPGTALVRLQGLFVFSTNCSMVVQWGSNTGGVNVTLKQGSCAMLWQL